MKAFATRFFVLFLLLPCSLCPLISDETSSITFYDLAQRLAHCGAKCGNYAPLAMNLNVTIRERHINNSCFLACQMEKYAYFEWENFEGLSEAHDRKKAEHLDVLCMEKVGDRKFLAKVVVQDDDSFLPMQAPPSFAVVRIVQLWKRSLVDGFWKERITRLQFGFSITFAASLNFTEEPSIPVSEQYKIRLQTFTKHGVVGLTHETDWISENNISSFARMYQAGVQVSETHALSPQLDYLCCRRSDYVLLKEEEVLDVDVDAKEDHSENIHTAKTLVSSQLLAALVGAVASLVLLLCLLSVCHCRLRRHLNRFDRNKSSLPEHMSTEALEIQRNAVIVDRSNEASVSQSILLGSPSNFWANTHLATKSTPKPPF